MRRLRRTAALLLVVVLGVLSASPAVVAQSAPVTFLDGGMVSDFPSSVTFFASVDTELDIEDVRVRFGVGPSEKNRYSYLDLDRGGSLVEGELEWTFHTSERYIPPGATVRFHFEVLDTDGGEHLSDEYEVVMHDARYEWEVEESGPLRIFYHGPVRSRAEQLSDAGVELLELMQPVTGGETDTPITVTLYNNNAEMVGAVQRRSATTSRELVTQGQAFHRESVVLVLAGRRDIGTLTHELTHILVGRAAGNTTLVPLWLNEGLAEYGNLDQGLSYQYYLEWAVDTDRLRPFSNLNRFPGDPNMNLVAYGQSRSFIEYLIETYGGEKIAEVLAHIGEENTADTAFQTVFGKSILTLENEWRYAMGADEYVPPRQFAAPATSTPVPTAVPATIPTSTPTPEPTATSTPTATPEPEVALATSPTAGDASSDPAAVEPTAVEAAGSQDPAATNDDDADGGSGGGSCSAPGDSGHLEAVSLVWIGGVLWLVGLAARRRRT